MVIAIASKARGPEMNLSSFQMGGWEKLIKCQSNMVQCQRTLIEIKLTIAALTSSV